MKKMLAVAAAAMMLMAVNAFAAMPAADGEKLLQYLTKEKPYTAWKLWPGKGKLYKGTEPHGALLTTYVNDVALKSIKARKGMKDGSIIVKENYMPDKKLAAITVMYKVKGYNPEVGDWFWMKYAPDGKIETSGKTGMIDMCTGCHTKVKDNDYLFTGKIKK